MSKLSGAENSSESQVENTVIRKNSICCFICTHFLSEDVAGGRLFRGKVGNRGIGRR